MSVFKQSKKAKAAATRRRRITGEESLSQRVLDKGHLTTGALFLLFTMLVIGVCFVGLTPRTPQVFPGQISRERVISDFAFSYTSDVLTEERRRQREQQIPLVYRIEMGGFEAFRAYVEKFLLTLDSLEAESGQMDLAERAEFIDTFMNEFDPERKYDIASEDVALLLARLDSPVLESSLSEGMKILRSLYDRGIFDAETTLLGQDSNFATLYIKRDETSTVEKDVVSLDKAREILRIHLLALDLKREEANALYRILANGVAPSVKHSEKFREQLKRQELSQVEPVTVQVSAGQAIIDKGQEVTMEDVEMLGAYRGELQQRTTKTLLGGDLGEKVLMTLTLFLSVVVVLTAGKRRLVENSRKIALCVFVLVTNVGIIRLLLEMGELQLQGTLNNTVLTVLPYLVPYSLGAILVTLLVDSRIGALVGFLVCLLASMMQGESITLFLSSFLATMIGVYFSCDILLRTKVVKAGFLAGLVLACFAGIMGLYNIVGSSIVVLQAGAALLNGVVTGILAAALLPTFERLFGYTTNIALHELTDYNHPLIRRMQVEAPGTFHHSLMVAQLSERAALAVGANAYVCRTAAIYHDIGKLVKPEYFVENQREGLNPHIYQNPSMSALVIKAHVKEGVALAREYRLPKPIIDVIKEHHGTSLIQYFFYKALEEQKNNTIPLFPGAPAIELEKVNENTYRYEGPKPHFVESAIICLADSIEAASRSLPKTTPQAIEDLVDDIIASRIEDEQLSDAPITFEDLTKIKESFCFSLMNMLHSRVEYPEKDEELEARGTGKQTKDKRDKERREKGKTRAPFGQHKNGGEGGKRKGPGEPGVKAKASP